MKTPPGPPAWRFHRTLTARYGNPLRFFERLQREYGNAAHFRVLNERFYFFNEPEWINEILVTKDACFRKGRALEKAKRFLGNSLLVSEGGEHTRQRKLIQPAFHRQRIAGYGRTIAAQTKTFGDRWRDGERIDIAAEMNRLTLQIVAQTLFGAVIEAETGEISKALTTLLLYFDRMLIPFGDLIQKLPLPSNRRFNEAQARLDEVILKMIRERRASGEDRGDLLSMLLASREDGGGLSDREVRDQTMTLFIAGHETTANALAWTWYLLAQNPEHRARLEEEVDQALGGRPPQFEDLPRLPFANRVLSESMRIYPPAWAVGRRALTATQIGPWSVPRRGIVVVSQYLIHRDSRFHPDPLKFDPDRWLPEAKEQRPKFSYFPFGGGSRVCIGESFAWMESTLILATLMQRWRFDLDPTHPVEPRPRITLRPKDGIVGTLLQRKTSGPTAK